MGPVISNQNFHQFTVDIGQFTNLSFDTDDQTMMSVVVVHNSTLLKNWKQNLITLHNLKPQHILLPLEYKKVKQNICGGSKEIEIIFESFHISLAQELSKRVKVKQYLEEQQIWYLLYTLVSAASVCHRVNSGIGDLRPSSILLNKIGKIKIFNKFTTPSFKDPYYENQKTSLFSPEQLDSLKRTCMENDNNYILAQSFTIGLICLCSGLLKDPLSIYDYQRLKIDQYQFENLKKQWINLQYFSSSKQKTIKYSEKLKKIILSMIQFRPFKRLSSTQIEKILNPHIQNIMNQKQFSLSQLPINLYQTNRKSQNRSSGQIHSFKRRVSQNDYKQQTIPRPKSSLYENNQLVKHFSFMTPSDQYEDQIQVIAKTEKCDQNTVVHQKRRKEKLKTSAKLYKNIHQQSIN